MLRQTLEAKKINNIDQENHLKDGTNLDLHQEITTESTHSIFNHVMTP